VYRELGYWVELIEGVFNSILAPTCLDSKLKDGELKE